MRKRLAQSGFAVVVLVATAIIGALIFIFEIPVPIVLAMLVLGILAAYAEYAIRTNFKPPRQS